MQVCSAVEVSGFFLCLFGAARITHRAQTIASVATKWHMTVTCANRFKNSNIITTVETNHTNCEDNNEEEEEEDGGSDSSDDILTSVSPQDSSSFHIRQALGQWLCFQNLLFQVTDF